MSIKVSYFKDIKLFLNSVKDTEKKYLLFITEKTNFSLLELNKSNICFYGAIFPKIVFDNCLYDKGLICLELNSNANLKFIKNINNVTLDNSDFIDSKSIITIVNGFSKYIDEFLTKLYNHTNLDTSFIGGGSGLLLNDKEATIFDKEGFYTDASILLSLNKDINIGVQHGFEYLEGPFIVTKCEKNILKKIDYKSACEVYKNVIEKDTGLKITKDNFSVVSKNYPLGIVKYQGEHVVREVINYENTNLYLLGDINENTIVNVLKGNKEKMINAAEKAAKTVKKIENQKYDNFIIFECVSRVTFLKEKYEKELTVISSTLENKNIFGLITVGEIANSGNRNINFFNQTCVVGGICQ